MTTETNDTIDLDGIDLDLDVSPAIADIGEQDTTITVASMIDPVGRFPPANGGPVRGEMFFDLETVPDDSRRHLFGLDEPVEVKPQANPPMEMAELMKKTIGQITDIVAASNPTDLWIEAFEAWERNSEKPRDGVIKIAKGLRATRSSSGDAEAERVKKMSITPEFCRIVAMGIGMGEAPEHVHGFVALPDSAVDEVELLEWWWDCAKSASTVAGYNILGFDLPVIFARSAILGVKPTRRFDMRPWGSDVLDLMKARWPAGNAMKLKDLARIMGIEIPAGDVDGSQVAELYRTDPAKLAVYVKSDVVLCQHLRRMWRGFFC